MGHIILGIVIQIEGLFKTLDAYFIFKGIIKDIRQWSTVYLHTLLYFKHMAWSNFWEPKQL